MPFEIWFEFASTYSYLTVMRAEPLLREAGIEPEWRPFLLGPILRHRGLDGSPFTLDPLRGRYMWRDVERRAARCGLAFTRPPVFPMQSLHAARLMTAMLGTPLAARFVRAVFDAAYARGEDIGDSEVLKRVLAQAGADPGPWMERARCEDVKQALRARTDEALKLGIFGAPSFRVGDELFWGDDRLEDALAWAATEAA